MKTFLPFSELKNRKNVIIVDGQHADGFVLSHWRGANKHSALEADTSGDIVLNAILKNCPELAYPFVSATHFDIDGMVGVWSLCFPELALKYESVLRQTANLGDFRHFDPRKEGALHALQLCCWLNAVEKREFYQPYGSDEELDDCVAKFDYFLPRFAAVLEYPKDFISDWREEYERVLVDWEKTRNAEQHAYPELGLVVKVLEEPIHYYALFADTAAYDIVLSLYSRQRYELEIKYTTWVDIVSRPTLPRVQLKTLAAQLNRLEQSGNIWDVDKITDTGPILRLEGKELSKAERYANPFERDIFSSSIEPKVFEQLVIDFLRQEYTDIIPKKFWTWKEIKV